MNWLKIYLLFVIQICVAFTFRNNTKYSPKDLFFTKPKYYTAAFSNSVKQGYVRLKLLAFIFDVPSHVKQEKVDPSDHLRRLAKPYPQILLDPGYTFTVMVDYFPLKILEQICEPFQAASRTSNEHVPTSTFVVNDVGTMVNRPGHDRLLQLFFQITASLGLPTLTWMPNRVGTFEICVAFTFRNNTKYSPKDLFFTKPKYYTAAFSNSVKQGYVRLKLLAFIFDVPSHVKQEKVDPSDHLRRLAKPYPQILLDPGYTFTVMVDYFPLKILEQICEPFQAASRTSNEHVPTSTFVVNDVGTMVNRPGHDRLLQLFFQITASLGLPTLTWMPNRVGTFELEDNQLVVRLEPLTWHLARALVDFAQTFNWNFIIVLYNEHAPGSKPLLSEIKRLQVERGKRFHPNFYEFEIEAFLGFDGFTNSKLSECTRPKRSLNTECFGSLIASMQKIWEAQSRFVIFNGNQ
nr:hypothetical transcript [Hymenolepis microstoma]